MSRLETRLSRSISFRLHEADYAKVAYSAAVANLRVNELARLRTLQNRQALIIRAQNISDPAVIAQLIAIGNNMNQMVKRFHLTGRVSPHLEAICRKIDQLIDAAIDSERGI